MSPSQQVPPLNRVELLLEQAAKDKALIPVLGTAVLDSDVYVLGATAGPIPDGKPHEEDPQVNLVTLDTANGPIIPFFSSEAVMDMVLAYHPRSERGHLRLQGRILFEMTQGHHLVLNPDRPHGKVFSLPRWPPFWPAHQPRDNGVMEFEAMIEAASEAREHAYVPYSGFRMGAAVLTTENRIVPGSLVENVSLGLAMCAERVALFASVAAGARPRALALVSPRTDGAVTFPCGACLQVGLELGGPDVVVVAVSTDGVREQVLLGDLLPHGPRKT